MSDDGKEREFEEPRHGRRSPSHKRSKSGPSDKHNATDPRVQRRKSVVSSIQRRQEIKKMHEEQKRDPWRILIRESARLSHGWTAWIPMSWVSGLSNFSQLLAGDVAQRDGSLDSIIGSFPLYQLLALPNLTPAKLAQFTDEYNDVFLTYGDKNLYINVGYSTLEHLMREMDPAMRDNPAPRPPNMAAIRTKAPRVITELLAVTRTNVIQQSPGWEALARSIDQFMTNALSHYGRPNTDDAKWNKMKKGFHHLEFPDCIIEEQELPGQDLYDNERARSTVRAMKAIQEAVEEHKAGDDRVVLKLKHIREKPDAADPTGVRRSVQIVCDCKPLGATLESKMAGMKHDAQFMKHAMQSVYEAVRVLHEANVGHGALSWRCFCLPEAGKEPAEFVRTRRPFVLGDLSCACIYPKGRQYHIYGGDPLEVLVDPAGCALSQCVTLRTINQGVEPPARGRNREEADRARWGQPPPETLGRQIFSRRDRFGPVFANVLQGMPHAEIGPLSDIWDVGMMYAEVLGFDPPPTAADCKTQDDIDNYINNADRQRALKTAGRAQDPDFQMLAGMLRFNFWERQLPARPAAGVFAAGYDGDVGSARVGGGYSERFGGGGGGGSNLGAPPRRLRVSRHLRGHPAYQEHCWLLRQNEELRHRIHAIEHTVRDLLVGPGPGGFHGHGHDQQYHHHYQPHAAGRSRNGSGGYAGQYGY